MRFAELVSTSTNMSATRSRNEKTELLAALLRKLAPDEIEPAVGFLTGDLWQGKIGLGYATAFAGRLPGDTAPSSSTVADVEPGLTIGDVDRALSAIKDAKGKGSANEKRERFALLLARAGSDDARELLRHAVVGELRQGAQEGVMQDAIARASSCEPALVRRAAMLSGDLRLIARTALVEGAAALARFQLELFRPVLPMLADTAPDATAALEQASGVGGALFEHKLDGARVQVHKDGDDVRVYTRNLIDATARVPEVVSAARALPARAIVLDGEAIALDESGRPRPFQVTMRRFGRKLDVEAMERALPLSVVFFDALRVDDATLIDVPVEERARALSALAPSSLVIPRCDPATAEEAEAFFDDAIERGHEGLVAKLKVSTYEAGRRGSAWLKVKPAHTLDLVVLAVERGSGRRQGWLSNIHLGARDPATGGFVMLGKTFKGMTDATLAWQTERFRALAVDDDGYVVRVRPEQVAEIAFDGVQRSPVYEGGLALRFARLKRYRADKAAHDASSVDEVRKLLVE